MNKVDSIKKRYLNKLGTNFVNLILGFITISLVPRSLGPMNYGNFSFLTNFFNNFIEFFTFSTPLGYFTKLSKRNDEQKLIRFYFSLVSIVIFIVLLLVTLIFVTNGSSLFWPGQEKRYIIFALNFSILTFFASIIHRTNDALAFTVQSEKSFLLQKLISALLIFYLFFNNFLTIDTFFVHHFLILLFIIVIWMRFLNKNEIKPFSNKNRLSSNQKRNYIKEFYIYSHPLFAYSLVALSFSTFDIWLLQYFAGSEEQGYFGVTRRIGYAIFIFSGALTPIFTREFSIAWDIKDYGKMRLLFKDLLPLFFFIISSIGVFVSFHSESIISFIVGSEYESAIYVLSIMAFYPIHQTYGQLSGSVFYATNRTKLYRNTGLAILPIGLLISLYLQLPNKFGGLELGATGLAVKMIITQFITVNFRLWFNLKLLKMNYLKFFLNQTQIILILSIIAFITKTMVSQTGIEGILNLILCLLLYVLFLPLILWFIPQLLLKSRSEMISFVKRYLKI